MKKIIIVLMFLVMASTSYADTIIDGHDIRFRYVSKVKFLDSGCVVFVDRNNIKRIACGNYTVSYCD